MDRFAVEVVRAAFDDFTLLPAVGKVDAEPGVTTESFGAARRGPVVASRHLDQGLGGLGAVGAFLEARPVSTYAVDGMDGGYGSGAHSREFLRALGEPERAHAAVRALRPRYRAHPRFEALQRGIAP